MYHIVQLHGVASDEMKPLTHIGVLDKCHLIEHDNFIDKKRLNAAIMACRMRILYSFGVHGHATPVI